jgi:hypothetical protein
MTTKRPPISQKVLAELARKVRQNNPPEALAPTEHPPFTTPQLWGLVLIGVAWLVLALVAPILLILLLFGINYTGLWVIAAGWLVGISFVTLGVYLIVGWIVGYLNGQKQSLIVLLYGVSTLLVTSGAAFLLLGGADDRVPPLLVIGVATLLLVLATIWGTYRLLTERQTPLIARLSFLAGMLCMGGGLALAVFSIQRAFLALAPDTYHSMQTVGSLLANLGWALLLISQAFRSSPVQQRWTKRATILLLVIAVAIILLIGLRLSR